MKTYLTYKNQIKGFEDVSETVKIIEKVAASSIHFLKQEVSRSDLYESEVKAALLRLSLFYRKNDNILLKKRSSGRRTLIILTGEKGLVGGLWQGIINAFLKKIGKYDFIVAIGAKGENYLTEENIKILKSFSIAPGAASKEDVASITNYIFDKFREGMFAEADILYPKFVSLAEQQPVFVSFLPFEFKLNEEDKNADGFPIFESSKKEIFNSLLEKYIGMFFYKILKETKLSELSARTVAMEHASAKTDEFVKKLVSGYLKERHLEVTQKQLESFMAHKII